MMTLIILLIIFFTLWIFRPMIKRWVMRQVAKKAEDMFRSAAGMPPRQKKRRTAQERTDRRNPFGGQDYGRGYNSDNKSVIPKEYAEDVEYTEYKDTGDNAGADRDRESRHVEYQEQVSDAEYTEIKEE